MQNTMIVKISFEPISFSTLQIFDLSHVAEEDVRPMIEGLALSVHSHTNKTKASTFLSIHTLRRCSSRNKTINTEECQFSPNIERVVK